MYFDFLENIYEPEQGAEITQEVKLKQRKITI